MKIELGSRPEFDDGDAPRDAVHVAIIAVIAEHELKPGEHIGMVNNRVAGVSYIDRNGNAFESISQTHKIGIVDPFLTENVKRGEWFWMVLYPNTVKNLRHVWDHDIIQPDDWVGSDYDDGCRGC